MKIKTADYLLSAVRPDQYPEEELPQIVFLGRSNVGKSSLINRFLNRKNLARTSAQPGKTRLVNFYRVQAVNEEQEMPFYLVDLPGYGFARISKTERENLISRIDVFLQHQPDLKYCWQLVDIRHAPSDQDVQMCLILRDAGYRLKVIATKADKISRGARDKHLAEICRDLGIGRHDVILTSSETGEGKEELLAAAQAFLQEFGQQA